MPDLTADPGGPQPTDLAIATIAAQPSAARRSMPRVDRRELAAIFVGGALGTLLRAGLAEAFPHPEIGRAHV